MDQEILSRLAIALGIGLLVGLERGWRSREEEDHQRAAGFRTFALTGLLGGVTGVIAQRTGVQLIGFVFLGFTLAFAAFHWLEARAEQNLSVTSVVAGMLTFLLGAMAVVGDHLAAIACAVTMTVLLALREQLHRWVASLTWLEIRAVLILLAMTFLLLPVLPNRTVDPWDTINPYEIWLLAILIAALSFSGYVAVKVLGERLGVVMTALAGGLASSTATTLSLARLAREHPGSARLLAGGILVAGVVMVVRVMVVAGLINRALLPALAPSLAAGAAALAAGASFLLLRNSGKESPRLEIRNPLALGTAVKLALLIAVVTLSADLLRAVLGNAGVLLVAAVSGVADVDAVTLSMARLGGKDVDQQVAVWAILLAVAVNTASKAVLAGWTGGRRIGVLVGTASAIAIACGAAVAVTLAR
jgi:uncharacterized membrane protein (DUF4010 family)